MVLTIFHRLQRRKLVASRKDYKDNQRILLRYMLFSCKDRVNSTWLTCNRENQGLIGRSLTLVLLLARVWEERQGGTGHLPSAQALPHHLLNFFILVVLPSLP